jgi:hypothetical protein
VSIRGFHSRFLELGKGVMEIWSGGLVKDEALPASFSQELAGHKFGFRDANAPLVPRLHHSDFFWDLQQRTQRAEEGNLTERDEGAKTDRRTDNFSQQGDKGHKYKSS